METIRHNNYTETQFVVSYEGEKFNVSLFDSNNRVENMRIFISCDAVAWSVQYDKRASNSMRRVLDKHNTELLYRLIKAQISKKMRVL